MRPEVGAIWVAETIRAPAAWGAFAARGGSTKEVDGTNGTHQQGKLLRKKPNAITSKPSWPAGKRLPGGSFRGYQRGDFEAAWREHTAAQERGGPRLRLVPPPLNSRRER
jgi:hypothetical protein